MNIPDVNVLVPLFRADHSFHASAKAWWAAATKRGEPFTIPDVVWMGFMRLVTDPRCFKEPDSLADAWAFRHAVSAQPLHLKYVPGPDTMANCQRASTAAKLSGSSLSDAYIAACAMDYGATIVTFDRDFRKFDDLRVLELS